MKEEYSKENLLIVDDEIEVRQVVAKLLSNLGFHADSESSGKNALQKMRTGAYTFLITDINMPEINGIELIKRVKKEKHDISIIAMTGFDKDYTYMDVINAGANDFITKPFKIDEIEAKISRILIEKRVRDELATLSITDNLTGLFNQRHFHNKLKDEVNRANRQNHPLSLILLDLDKFKEYNDKYGHLEGDRILAKSGKIILANIRENVDTAFRYGGDEFAIILVEADNEIVLNTGERIKKGFAEGDGVTASIGFATYSSNMDVNDFIALADKDLYESKKRNMR
jgi:two-component system cell cycle response regulator